MTRLFLLDTDSVSYAMRGQGNVGARILEHRPSELAISAITLAELRYGAERRGSARLHGIIEAFISNVAVLPFDDVCATRFGTLAADLAARGTPIGELDVLIAAHAITAKAVLVTNNVKQFSRVKGLAVENWS